MRDAVDAIVVECMKSSPPVVPHVMVKCACGCPNHPQAVRCAACSRVLAS